LGKETRLYQNKQKDIRQVGEKAIWEQHCLSLAVLASSGTKFMSIFARANPLSMTMHWWGFS
jgi:hypothetical protein